ncbi:MAG: periplasmic heavy metal sensor [Pseudomonas sp.]
MKKTWILGGVLLLSLGANAFLAGWIVNRSSTAPFAELGQTQPVRELIGKVLRLPKEQRQEVRGVISQHAPHLRELAAEMRGNRQVIVAQLTGETIDVQQVQASFARQRDTTVQLQTAAQTMMLEMAQKLPQEQRRQLLSKP